MVKRNGSRWVYNIEKCPECGHYVAANWTIRHRRGGCKGGRVSIRQLLAAYVADTLPPEISVVTGPTGLHSTELAAWRINAELEYGIEMEWITDDDDNCTWVGFNDRTNTLVIVDGEYYKRGKVRRRQLSAHLFQVLE